MGAGRRGEARFDDVDEGIPDPARARSIVVGVVVALVAFAVVVVVAAAVTGRWILLTGLIAIAAAALASYLALRTEEALDEETPPH